MKAYLNRVLDRAERSPLLIPAAALSLGFGTGYGFRGAWYGWWLLGAGLVLIAIRPLGTDLRRRARLRELRRDLDAAKRQLAHLRQMQREVSRLLRVFGTRGL